MEIAECLSLDRILFLENKDKENVLQLLSESLASFEEAPAAEEILKAIECREAILSTGLGRGLAVPHVRLEGVSQMLMAVALLDREISFGSMDGEPVRVVVMILAPPGQHREYLHILSRIIGIVKDSSQYRKLLSSKTSQDVYASLVCI